MRHLYLFRFIAAGGLLLLMCSGVAADPITYRLTGIVTDVDPILSSTFDTSQTLSGSFTYESSAEGVLFGSDANGFSDYQQMNTLLNFTMTIGPYEASRPFTGFLFTGIQVANNYFGSDRFVLSGGLTGTQFNELNPYAFLSLDDTSKGSFSDTKLSNVGDLTGWTSQANHSGVWYLAFSRDGGSPRLLGQLTSIELIPALNIARSDNLAVLSWPAAFGNLQLQENANLSLANGWSAVTPARSTNNGFISATLPAIGSRKFFRLCAP